MRAAVEVLATRGFQRTKIRDIAQLAGVADGTIYLYFKNKDDLLIQLFEDVMDHVLSHFDRALEGKEDPEDKLRSLLTTHFQLVEYDPMNAKIISVVLRQSSTFVQEYKNPLFSKYLHLIEEILREGIEQGCFRQDLLPSVLGRAIFGALDEIALAWLLSRRRESSLEDAARMLSEMVLHGIRTEDEESESSK